MFQGALRLLLQTQSTTPGRDADTREGFSMINVPTLRQRALEELAGNRQTEAEDMAELMEKAENEARGFLQGALSRVLDVHPCTSFARVVRDAESPTTPDVVIEIDGLLLSAHYALGVNGDDEYALHLARRCSKCEALIHYKRIDSLLDLGKGIECMEDDWNTLCFHCDANAE